MSDQPVPVPAWIVNQWLRSLPAVTTVVNDRIGPVLGVMPAIRLSNVSNAAGPEESLARVQVECWAEDYLTAADLAWTIAAATPSLTGTWTAGDRTGHCAGGAVAVGPLDAPDEKTGRNRTTLDVELWVYPAPPAP